jgi:mRNA interferase RelE/StbE
MTYSLEFLPSAKKEWDKLDSTIRSQLKKKLSERLLNPRVETDKLHEAPERYKIKLKSVGYRLVYEVQDGRLVIVVVAVGKRENKAVYDTAAKRTH